MADVEAGAKVRSVVCRLDEFPPDTRRRVMVGGRAVVVFNIGGELSALRDVCPHQGAPLSEGVLGRGALMADGPGCYRYDRTRSLIMCPWHGWEFDVRTGESWFDPARTRTKTYPVGVEPAEALEPDADRSPSGLRPGHLQADPVSVAVEGDYVVIYAEERHAR